MAKRHFGQSELTKTGYRAYADATALLEKGRWRAAMYTVGYAVECGIKAKLMNAFNCQHLDDLAQTLFKRGTINRPEGVYTHNLELLWTWLPNARRVRRDPQHVGDINLINRWTVDWRYNPDNGRELDATDFLTAAERVLQLIRNNF